KARRPLVALAARAAAELVVDAPRLVALGANDVEAAELLHALAEQDVDTTSGHVRRHGDRALLARARDDERLAPVVLRVQHLVPESVPPSLVRQALTLVY